MKTFIAVFSIFLILGFGFGIIVLKQPKPVLKVYEYDVFRTIDCNGKIKIDTIPVDTVTFEKFK